MRRITIPLCVVTAAIVWSIARRPRPPDFAPDWATATAQARADGAWRVVHLRRDDRPASVALDRLLAGDEAKRALGDASLRAFHHVRLDAAANAALVTPWVGIGGAVATLVVDEEEELVGRLDGFVELDALARFLRDALARRPAIEAAKEALRRDDRDDAARVALAGSLVALGALDRAELLLTRAARGDGDAAARALDALAELQLRRGQTALAERTQAERAQRYPAPPSSGNQEENREEE